MAAVVGGLAAPYPARVGLGSLRPLDWNLLAGVVVAVVLVGESMGGNRTIREVFLYGGALSLMGCVAMAIRLQVQGRQSTRRPRDGWRISVVASLVIGALALSLGRIIWQLPGP